MGESSCPGTELHESPSIRVEVHPMKGLLVVVAAACMCGGCADSSRSARTSGPSADTTAPLQVELRCGADGSTFLSSDTVQAQADGVHIDVVNEYDEPASADGFDAEPGRTTWVMTRPPGGIELVCWPFSLHSSGEEPPRSVLTVVDPQGLYVEATVPCEPSGITVTEWQGKLVDPGPPRLDVARDLIDGTPVGRRSSGTAGIPSSQDGRS